jgi:hypothetical protein
MYGRCETDPFDQAVDVCGSCYGEFCAACLVKTKGRKDPVCKECTIIASGVRPGAKPLIRGAKKTAAARRRTLRETPPAPPPFEYFDLGDEPGPGQPPPSSPPGAASPAPAPPDPVGSDRPAPAPTGAAATAADPAGPDPTPALGPDPAAPPTTVPAAAVACAGPEPSHHAGPPDQAPDPEAAGEHGPVPRSAIDRLEALHREDAARPPEPPVEQPVGPAALRAAVADRPDRPMTTASPTTDELMPDLSVNPFAPGGPQPTPQPTRQPTSQPTPPAPTQPAGLDHPAPQTPPQIAHPEPHPAHQAHQATAHPEADLRVDQRPGHHPDQGGPADPTPDPVGRLRQPPFIATERSVAPAAGAGPLPRRRATAPAPPALATARPSEPMPADDAAVTTVGRPPNGLPRRRSKLRSEGG